MRLFSYIVRYDIGFAPNPFHGMCTLATCKPKIRATARIDDWVIGTGSKTKKLEDRLVYAMRVDEIVDFDTYWSESRFVRKIPTPRGSRKQAYGDNIYHRGATGKWIQANSRHSLDDGSPNLGHIDRDTNTDAVLIGREFVYFGGSGPKIPHDLRVGYGTDLVHGQRSHRCRFPQELVDATADWIRSLGTGVRGRPADWG
ncbi:conserved hypothetical protein (plasmid) [Rhodococcus jostii RHA1]|uniref:Nucleotide modification associated domain-containing protein n=1 Tax=Rhodococcus jostii (strain RHA1) TaxID=101510 RepID=Q0RX22_RHOJR|nr:hypothetical protein [Rhodococcus jostii]ABH00164.1 conserved hypothetical protein [Rhodococcus jostii RHA1]